MDFGVKLICEDTIDGYLSCIYQGFVEKKKRYKDGYNDNISIISTQNYNYDMLSQYISIETDYENSLITASYIKKKLGTEGYNMVIRAICSNDPDKGYYIFGFLVRGFKMGSRIIERLGDEFVIRVMELGRKTGNEAHLFTGFIRFSSYDGFLISHIEPKCNVLPLIGNHFLERYPGENFLIYDKNRKQALVHKRFEDCFFVSGKDIEGFEIGIKVKDDFEDLWKVFFENICINERINPKCQNNLLPKWYRENMLEFDRKKSIL